ncbi:adaptor complexes medium subunit family protein [Pelomyxa schiedti]|nr:adaptor complexes medium subunit family protein [Pelomyxa schiedti]
MSCALRCLWVFHDSATMPLDNNCQPPPSPLRTPPSEGTSGSPGATPGDALPPATETTAAAAAAAAAAASASVPCETPSPSSTTSGAASPPGTSSSSVLSSLSSLLSAGKSTQAATGTSSSSSSSSSSSQAPPIMVTSAAESSIYGRRFGTVEARVRAAQGVQYSPIPPDSVFIPFFIAHVRASLKDSCCEYTSFRTHSECVCEANHHVLDITKLNSLWPVVWIKRMGLFFVGIPEIPSYNGTISSRPSLLSLPCVTSTISVLLDIFQFVTPFHPHFKPAQIGELNAYISHTLPFGHPASTTNPEISRAIMKSGFPSSTVVPSVMQPRRPGWKPVVAKSAKNQANFTIRETFHAAQYDNNDIPDTWAVSGAIICKADIEGTSELSVQFGNSSNDPTPTQISSLSWNYSVAQSGVSVSSGGDISTQLVGNKISFVPPTQQFVLASYTTQKPNFIPIRGFYQMKEDSPTEVTILLQLKIDKFVNNAFHYCEVHLPFKNRGTIASHQSTPTIGSVVLSPDQRTLVWNIGTKFTTSNLEAALPSSITFNAKPPTNSRAPLPPMETAFSTDTTNHTLGYGNYEPLDWGEGDLDPLCTGQTCYAKIRFKIKEWNVTGLSVQKVIAVTPSPKKVKSNVERECVTGTYIIWNSAQGARWAVQPALTE